MLKLARLLVRAIGWKLEGELPPCRKFVVILYPHTSNWDLPIGVLCATGLGLFSFEYGFMVKDSVVKAPILGPLIRWLGGIPVDRSATFNAVEQMAARFAERESMMLAITPEGTRKFRPYWKSGFYHIALAAKVPILCTYLDYGRKVGGLGPLLMPTGDVEADLDVLRKFYAPIRACHPKDAATIQFRQDDAQRAEPPATSDAPHA